MNIVGTLRIDGKLYNLQISPLGESTGDPVTARIESNFLAVTAPMPPPALPLEPPRSGPAQPKKILLLSYASSSGISKKNGKPYTIHKFKGADQKDYTTFRQELASQLGSDIGKRESFLYVEPDQRGTGYNILSIATPEREVV